MTPGKILLVEDDQQVRTLFLRALAREGYEVLGAADGVEALKLLELNYPSLDLLISEVTLPGVSGTTLARVFSELKMSSRVLFTSGDADLEGLECRLSILPKPFTLTVFLEEVATLIESGPGEGQNSRRLQ